MTTARVTMWGTRIGAVTWDEGRRLGAFEYDPDFLASGIQVAPIQMPLEPGIYAFPDLVRSSFHGLPGLVADALPDRFGNAVIDAWLDARGRDRPGVRRFGRLRDSAGRLQRHDLHGSQP